jgi:predicted acyl esterase
MGGCLLVDGIDWGAVFQTFLPRPPDPAILSERWRKVWNERLDGLVCPLEEWLTHLHRDAYWKHGSICENYDQIQAATLLVGGWVDGYKSALMRMAARLSCPVKCIMGPWAHLYPHSGVPGPAIGFLQEVVRWFDYWLKHIDNGVMNEPKLRAYIQESQEPRTHYEVRKGRWVGEENWPSETIKTRVWHLTDFGLSPQQSPLSEKTLAYNLAVGQFAGDWGAIALPYELPPDQRHDDALSLCFDSEPLAAPLEVLGGSVLRLEVCSDKPVAMIAARLNDVRPDGLVCKVSMGLLNLTHRAGSEYPEDLETERWYEVEIRLGDSGYRFPAGHRLRVSLSPSYWPIAWPSPEPVCLRIRGRCHLAVPERTAPAEYPLSFAAPTAAPGPDIVTLRQARKFAREVLFDLVGNTVKRRITGGTAGYGGEGLFLIRDIGLALEYTVEREQSIALDNPSSAVTEHVQQITFKRDDWHVAVKTRVRLACTAQEFLLNCDVDVFENDRRILARSWNPTFPRRCL